MKTSADLEQMLRDIDRKSYPAYKTLKGSYRFHTYILSIDHVQGDPFASPSRLTIRIDGKAAGFSEELWMTPDRMCAFCDFLLRRFEKAVLRYSFQAKGSGKSGAIFTTRCGQTVLRRTGCSMEGNTILMRFEAGFPANGRTINTKELRKILFDYLPAVPAMPFINGIPMKKRSLQPLSFMKISRRSAGIFRPMASAPLWQTDRFSPEPAASPTHR